MKSDQGITAIDPAAYVAAMAQLDPGVGRDAPVETWLSGGNVTLRTAEDGLVFLAQGHASERVRRRSTPKLLADFVNLRNASDETIRVFAERSGMLDLCEDHSMPLSGDAPVPADQVWDYVQARRWEEAGSPPVAVHVPSPFAYGVEQRTCQPFEAWSDNGLESWESVDDWRAYSNATAALIVVGVAVSRGESGRDEDWTALGIHLDEIIYPPDQTYIAYLNWWIKMSGLGLRVKLDSEPNGETARLSPVLTTGHLFAGVVREVIAAVAAPGRYAFCVECGGFYAPTRLPARTRRNFCPSCVEDGAPQRWAAREYQRRKAATKSRGGPAKRARREETHHGRSASKA